MAKDYYKILEVDKKASKDEIKKAFRKLAHKYHPDKGGTDEAKFKEITEAYSILSDDKKRREYDAYGQAFPGGAPGGAGGNPFAGFDFSQFQQGFGNGGVEFDFGDIFGDMFGGGRGARRGKPRGRDISIDVVLSFKEAMLGSDRKALVTKVTACETCNGSGAKPNAGYEECKTCQGKGQVREVRNSIIGQLTSTRVCGDCEGVGKIPKEKCAACKGRGATSRQEEIHFRIPPGIDNGEMVRLPQKGEAVKNGVPGDLFVRVSVREHPVFRREGQNLVMDLPVKLTDALFGTTAVIETIDEKKLEVKIPVMKRAEELLRVRGQGIPGNGGTRGDLIIRLETALPQRLSSKAKKALEDLKSEGL